MKEFIDKLIGRLEEARSKYQELADSSNFDGWAQEEKIYLTKEEMCEEIISIIKELAEEYGDEELRKSQKIYSFIKREINPYGKPFEGTVYEFGLKVMKYINNIHTEKLAEEFATDINVVSNNGWIAFTQRELNEEEKEHYGNEIKYMLDCKLPEEDEEILVTYKWKDEFYVDNDTFLRDGSECYLDSGRELITEAIAWMPLPAPYKEGNEENE